MSWNCRIVKQQDEHGYTFGLHEVYYNADGEPWTMTLDAIRLHGFEEVEDLREALKTMLQDAEAPVFEEPKVWGNPPFEEPAITREPQQ